MPHIPATTPDATASDAPLTKTIDLFVRAQSVYRRVVASNLLCHTEITHVMRREIAALGCESISILDLGCGDCNLLARVYKTLQASPDTDAAPAPATVSDDDDGITLPALTRFVGVDLTAEALEIAKTSNVFPEGCSFSLHEADFFQYLENSDGETFDVIMSSFAIHHLSTDRKAALLQLVAQRLNPGGVFLNADVYNVVAGRSRPDTMTAWEPHVLQRYTSLTEEERQTTWTHISQHDMPEDKPTMDELIKNAGFTQHRWLFEDQFYVAVYAASKY